MADKPWKRHERAIAKRLGGERAGPTGREGSDVLHPAFGVECKERKAKVQWIEEYLDQTKGASLPGQLPIVVLHWLGDRHNQDIVMMRLKDFEEWFGDPAKATECASE